MNLFLYDAKISKHKYFEFQIAYWNWRNLFKVELEVTTKGHDHAGPRFEIQIFGLMIAASIYDSRHWNYEKETWEEYDPKILEENHKMATRYV